MAPGHGPEPEPPPEPRPGPGGPGPAASRGSAPDASADAARVSREKRNARYVWWYLAYFLFGIHLVAFIMIFAVRYGK